MDQRQHQYADSEPTADDQIEILEKGRGPLEAVGVQQNVRGAMRRPAVDPTSASAPLIHTSVGVFAGTADVSAA